MGHGYDSKFIYVTEVTDDSNYVTDYSVKFSPHLGKTTFTMKREKTRYDDFIRGNKYRQMKRLKTTKLDVQIKKLCNKQPAINYQCPIDAESLKNITVSEESLSNNSPTNNSYPGLYEYQHTKDKAALNRLIKIINSLINVYNNKPVRRITVNIPVDRKGNMVIVPYCHDCDNNLDYTVYKEDLAVFEKVKDDGYRRKDTWAVPVTKKNPTDPRSYSNNELISMAIWLAEE